jgi:type I restriction enzyme, R subunit
VQPARASLVKKFHEPIAEYNAGSLNVEKLVTQLMVFIGELDEEDGRAIREGLTEEEVAVVDILTKPEPELNDQELALVKQVAKTMLDTLKREKLVLDWRLKERAKAAVRSAIQKSLDDLPPAYGDDIWQTKVEMAYEWVFDQYGGSPSEQLS